MKKNLLQKIAKASMIILPCSIFFSYHPLFHFGSDGLMNYELSLALIALVLFDIFAIVYLCLNRALLKKAPKRFLIVTALFPIYATLSILWSSSKMHGFFAAGIIWAIYLAVHAYGWVYQDLLKDKKFTSKFIKVFFGVSLFVCTVCWLQCIVDLLGARNNLTMMCTGCGYRIFGFPHPNGFMAEPQYLGGVLLAPTLLALYLLTQGFTKKRLALAFVLAATLFLSLSRGAIYALALASVVLIIATIIKQKAWRALWLIPVLLVAFLFTLNAQGLFAQFSKTDDTYGSGVSKVISQLSLGTIDVAKKDEPKAEETKYEKDPANAPELEVTAKIEKAETAHYDGYVEASTNGRTALFKASVALATASPRHFIFGVGIGSGGNAIYQNYIDPGYIDDAETAKMIKDAGVDIPSLNVQSEYAELLLEFGLIGIILIGLVAILCIQSILGHKDRLFLLALAVAYLVAFAFCSGLTNSLYLYLFIPIFYYVLKNYQISHAK